MTFENAKVATIGKGMFFSNRTDSKRIFGTEINENEIQNCAVRLIKLRPSVHLRSVAANCDRIFECFHILARYLYETRGSLNFLTVHITKPKMN